MRRTVGAHQLGEVLLDLVIAALECVVIGVADRGRVFAVIAPVMLRDLGG
jgi:hypothetical protein